MENHPQISEVNKLLKKMCSLRMLTGNLLQLSCCTPSVPSVFQPGTKIGFSLLSMMEPWQTWEWQWVQVFSIPYTQRLHRLRRYQEGVWFKKRWNPRIRKVWICLWYTETTKETKSGEDGIGLLGLGVTVEERDKKRGLEVEWGCLAEVLLNRKAQTGGWCRKWF